MAHTMDWYDLYKAATKNVGPRYRKLRGMDRDDWLHSVGLERRNVGADVAGAAGFVLLGCAVGIGIGLLFAPRRGEELRQQMSERVKTTAEKIGLRREGAGVGPTSPYRT